MNDAILLQQASGVHTHLLNLTIRDHSAYCQRHNFDYLPMFGDVLHGPDAKRHAFWAKCAMLRRAAEQGYQYIVWLDSDTWIEDGDIDLRTACPEDGLGMVWHGKDRWPEGPECYNHWNCILPSQPVRGQFVGASKARYSGQCVEILTVSGMRLTVTAGHPVITAKGTIDAGLLNEGDDLLHYSGERDRSRVSVGEHEKDAPPVAEEIFRSLKEIAFSTSARSELVRSVIDFHGDAKFFNGNVDIVGTYGQLWRDIIADRSQRLTQREFVRTRNDKSALLSSGAFHQLIRRPFHTGKCFLGVSDLGSATFDRHILPSERVGFGKRSQYYSARDQFFSNSRLSGFVIEGNLLDRDARVVRSNNLVNVINEDFQSERSRSLSKSRGLLHPVKQLRPRHSESVGKFLSRNSGQIHTDKIVKIKRFHYDGPVYDFETKDGVIIADNLLISNCGAIYVGNGIEAKRLLKVWWSSDDEGHCWHDQHALNRNAIPAYERLFRKPAPIRKLGCEWNAVPFAPFHHERPVVAAWHGWHYDIEKRAEAMQAHMQAARTRQMVEHCGLDEALQKADYCLQGGAYQNAAAFFAKAEELGGASTPEFYYRYAHAFTRDWKHAEAADIIRRALEMDPQNGQLWQFLGMCYDTLGEHELNREAQEKAARYYPGHPVMLHNLSLFLLRDGEWDRGFELMQWSYLIRERIARDPTPEWAGRYSADPDATLLVWSEQGIGDTLMLSRYVPRIDAFTTVPYILLEVQKPLQSLLAAQCWSGVTVVARPDDNSNPWEFDAHIGMFTLPRVLGADVENTSGMPYLKAPADKVEQWRTRITPRTISVGEKTLTGPMRIGFSWAGSAGHGNNHHRNAYAELFDTMSLLPDTKWYCLQRDIVITDEMKADNEHITFIGDEFEDMADTAGALANLDLVITIDSAIAHLAGALGVPCWVALSKSSDWRWLLNRDDTPWYDSVKLYRQVSLGDWQSVFVRIESALKERLAQ